jgi:pyruvate/2-oxoglutarate dehydrogenase complex dihydrolipoamide acyltransferase (E2) component
MAHEVVLPQLGFSMTDGSLVEWLVKDGDNIQTGAAIFSLETDKSVQEIESPAAGKIRILKAAGQTYAVGEILAVIE